VYRCPVCGECFETLPGLKLHFKYRHFGGPCPLCGREVKNMVSHIWRSHRDALHMLYLYLGGSSEIPREVRKMAYRMAEEAFRV